MYISVVRRAAYPKLIQFNARSVYKILIVRTTCVLQWSCTAILQQESPSHQGTKTDCSVEASERACRASETAEQGEERLRVRRARDRLDAPLRLPNRDPRLRQIRDNRRQSLATESEEEISVRDRLASETEEERAARLQRMSANHCQKLASETEEERAARLQRMSVTGWPLKLKKR